jgi:hypothetical protein
VVEHDDAGRHPNQVEQAAHLAARFEQEQVAVVTVSAGSRREDRGEAARVDQGQGPQVEDDTGGTSLRIVESLRQQGAAGEIELAGERGRKIVSSNSDIADSSG